MKKLLLSFIILLGFNANSQTTIYSNDFSVSTGLTIIDGDGDTNNWGLFTGNATTTGWGLTGNFAGSRSWNPSTGTPPGPLTPNNFLITPEIVIPANFDATTLSFKIGSNDTQTFFAEKISIYLAPLSANTAALISALTPVFTYTLTAANKLTAITQTVDVSSYAGQTVKIVMRHYDCIDQDLLYLDDLLITQAPLATESFFTQNFKVFPNPATTVVNILSKNNVTINQIQITDLNGRVVKSLNSKEVTTQVNIADLNAGVYFLKVATDSGVGTTKIVKN